jgi:aspartyl-tRNA(Asn)/glutamyl-tRNA(Gln) amidotransferase subunit B
MDEGSLRCDANVSIRPLGSETLGTKTELKNMNSFRYLERGVAAEIERQTALVMSGGEVAQETLHFDPRSGSLTPLRSKEYSHDYRYFPEPDLPPLAPSEAQIQAARDSLPELPEQRRERYAAELGLPADQATQLAFDSELGDYFERALAAAEGPDGVEAPVLSNWVIGDLAAAAREAGADGPAATQASPEAVASLAAMVAAKKLNRGSGREVLATLAAEGGDPAEIAAARGLLGIDDSGELEAVVEAAIAAQPEAAEKVRAGEGKAIGVIVGAVMKETRGRADGGEVTRLIRLKLGL